MLIDTHCHLNSLSQENRRQVIQSCSSGYVLINSSIDLQSSKESLRLCGDHSFIYSALGFHPFSACQYDPQILRQYKELALNHNKVVAIGEIGLDYKADISLEKQEEIFRKFIELADNLSLPIVIHNRLEGFGALRVLDDYLSSYENVIFHCFSYSQEFLDKIIAKGGYVSFSLNILRGSAKIIASLRKCPLENLLLETDSPYMRLEGKPSTPLDIDKVYKFAAKTKDIEQKELEDIVFTNARKVFKFK
jgi:TatD DNase family protein